MINIGSTLPPVNKTPSQRAKTRLGDVAVSKHLPQRAVEIPEQDRRSGGDRRHDQRKPLIELRHGRDRRQQSMSIDTQA